MSTPPPNDPTTRAPISPVRGAIHTLVSGLIGSLAAKIAGLGVALSSGDQIALVVLVMAVLDGLGNEARNRGWWIGGIL